jgi:hypothetical protein
VVGFRLVFLGTIALALLLMRRRVWVIRGAGFLALSAILAAADGLWGAKWVGWASFWLLPVAVGIVVRNSWVVSVDTSTVSRTVEDAGRALWMTGEKFANGYEFRPGRAHLVLRWRSVPGHCVILTFSSRPRHKKMELLKRLLFKKFPPLFPRPQFKI